MKTAVIMFRHNESIRDGEYVDKLASIFYANGFGIDHFELLNIDDEIGFVKRVENLKDLVDNLVVIYNPQCLFDVRNIIAKSCDSVLDENENAYKFFDAVCKKDGVDYPQEYAYVPVDAILIPNIMGAYQGFMIDDKEITLTLLPNGIKEISVMVDKYLVPLLEAKFNLHRKRITLKYVGDIDKLNHVLQKSKEISDCKFISNVTEKYGDVKIDFLFEDYENKNGGEVVRYIVSSLKDEIYAEYDVSLAERLFDVLTLKNLKLSTAESFTSGSIASSIVKNSGASKVFLEGIVCYSNKSKIKRLGVKSEDLAREGAVSSIVAYQMALGLLQDPECDVAIATTGIAGPKSDDTLKPVGLCYIAVGMRDGIHTYRFNLNGNRKAITEQAKNKALFLTIKKLKNL